MSSSGGHLCFSYKVQIVKSSPEAVLFCKKKLCTAISFNLSALNVELIEFKVNMYVLKFFIIRIVNFY